uniref:Uncharacterized protein n=1 Tax=Anopheles farauti TaxID=69004 RepID=A0A182PZV6_9DIPT
MDVICNNSPFRCHWRNLWYRKQEHMQKIDDRIISVRTMPTHTSPMNRSYVGSSICSVPMAAPPSPSRPRPFSRSPLCSEPNEKPERSRTRSITKRNQPVVESRGSGRASTHALAGKTMPTVSIKQVFIAPAKTFSYEYRHCFDCVSRITVASFPHDRTAFRLCTAVCYSSLARLLTLLLMHRHYVTRQIRRIGERFRTVLTAVRLFQRVRPHVLLQRPPLRERAWTVLAGVWFFVTVAPQMRFVVFPQHKRLVAHIANERANRIVTLDVCPVLRTRPEPCLTDRAPKRFVSRVDPLVFLQVAALGESFRAVLTFERLHTIVPIQVLVVSGFVGKLLIAHCAPVALGVVV